MSADKPPPTITAAGGPPPDLPSHPPQKLPEQIGPYRVVGRLGEGGMGTVYKAEQRVPVRRTVAIKVVKLGMDTGEVVARFESERQALARMDHPGIARVLDAGADERGRPYFVMEFVPGIPITSYADRERLPLKHRLLLFLQVCDAIAHAHSKAILHRDIKSSNVLAFTDNTRKPIAKVIDFGVAKALTSDRLTDKTFNTQMGLAVGTYESMSPEQADGSPDLDARTDVYALGVLLYELLAGAKPLSNSMAAGVADAEIRRVIRDVDPPRPSIRITTLGADEGGRIAAARRLQTAMLAKELRTELEWIPMMCLRKERDRRYASPLLLATDVRNYLEGLPLQAGPDTRRYRLGKLASRNKGPIAAALAVLAVLVLGIVGTTIGLLSEARERKVAEVEKNFAQGERAEADRQRTIAQDARAQAVHARDDAEREAVVARRAAARSDALYLMQEELLPQAFARATDAWKLGGKWEDGFTFDRIKAAATRDWELVTRVPITDATAGCFVRHNERNLLIIASGNSLLTFDIGAGRVVGAARLDAPVVKLLPDVALGDVTAVHANSLDRLALPRLRKVASRQLQSPYVFATANQTQILLIDLAGAARILSLADFATVDVLPWDENRAALHNLSRPSTGDISGSGKHVLLHGGEWTTPFVWWDRVGGKTDLQFPYFRANRAWLVDERRIFGWFVRDRSGGTPSETHVYELGLPGFNPGSVTEMARKDVVDEDIKAGIDVQLTVNSAGNAAFTLFGDTGCVSAAMAVGTVESDRYANLVPFTAEPPSYLCAIARTRMMAIAQHDGVLIFHKIPRSTGGIPIHNYSARAFQHGLLDVNYEGQSRPHLNLTSFDTSVSPRNFDIQWDVGSGPTPQLVPWAICSTPDASVVAVIAQESAGGETNGTRYGTTHALIYKNPGGINAKSLAPWLMEKNIDLKLPPIDNWAPRFAAMSPGGDVLLYVTAENGAHRFSLTDNKPLAALPLSLVCHLSDDGRLAAGIDPSNQNLNVFDIASGTRVMSLGSCPGGTAVCLSADNARLMVADGSTLKTYAVPGGNLLSTVSSPLLPVALPAGNLDRFVAVQPDEKGDGGTLVMADIADAHVVTVLKRAVTRFCPAAFSSDGKSLTVLPQRSRAEIYHSFSPEQLIAASPATPSQPATEPATTKPK